MTGILMQAAVANRHSRGRIAYLSGVAAEDRIAQDYERRGFTVAQRRWRSAAGEIDLIVCKGGELVFVEIKKSRSIDQARARLRPSQVQRIYMAAEIYADTHENGSLTPMRFDVACVGAQGEFEILENAFL